MKAHNTVLLNHPSALADHLPSFSQSERFQTTRLWITPAPGDETRCLLLWNSADEQYQLPSFFGEPFGGSHLAGGMKRHLPWPAEVLLDVSPHPTACLRSRDLQCSPQWDSTHAIHAAWTDVDDSRFSERGLHAVTTREIQMGFTRGGRPIDPWLRDMLEHTGRLFPRQEFDERTITVGVVGHRNLPEADIPVLFDKLHQVIEDIEHEFPGRNLRVLSSLSVGAELLLADVASERRIPLTAPLALPVQLQEQLIATSIGIEDFRQALSQSHDWYVLPLAAGCTLTELEQHVGAQREHLARARRHVTERCNILLAAWDGSPSTEVGDTADTLRHALQPSRRPDRRLLIRHVPVRRYS